MYPITLNIEHKKCVIVGGGKMAFVKAKPLLQAHAAVTVVSPEICEELSQLYEQGKIQVLLKEVEKEDYEDAFLIIAATNSQEINQQIYENAHEKQLVNVISNHEWANFHVPATLHRGKLTISISTNGASPKLAKKIRQDLSELYDETYEDYVDFLFQVRMIIKKSMLTRPEKNQLLQESISDKYRNSFQERERFLKRIVSFTIK